MKNNSETGHLKQANENITLETGHLKQANEI